MRNATPYLWPKGSQELVSGGEVDPDGSREFTPKGHQSSGELTASKGVWLAHHVLIWARDWLAPSAPRLQHSGFLRLVRDVLHVSGFLVFDAMGQLLQIVLNRAAPLASQLVVPLRELLTPLHIAVSLGET